MNLSAQGEGSYMDHLKTWLVGWEGEDEDAWKWLWIERLRRSQGNFNATDEQWA